MERRGFLKLTLFVSPAVASSGCLSLNNDDSYILDMSDATATVHTTPTCSCCDDYADYLKETTGVEIRKKVHSSLSETKSKFGIPPELESCHTVELKSDTDTRIIEGHVPVEAVEKMFESRTSKIALPGMPPGSPGMGGSKREPFTVYSIDERGDHEVFAEV